MADYFTTSQLQLSRNYLDGDFNDVGFNSKHDPLTGLDTGSGNDRFNQYVTGDGSDQLQLDTGSGNDRLIGIDTGSGNDHIVHHVGGTSGPGGTSFFSGYSEAVGLDSSTVDVMNNVISSLQPANEFI